MEEHQPCLTSQTPQLPHVLGLSKLWAWLKSHHYVSEKNEAYADPVKRGFLVVHVQNYERDGAQFSNCTTKIAPKGIYHFHKLLKRDGLIPPDNQINFEFLGEPA